MSRKNHLFSQIRARMPDRAKTFLETADGETLSYEELVDLSGRYANVLADLGLKPGDRVAVQARKSVAGLVLYLAAVRAGGVFLPLNPVEGRWRLAGISLKTFKPRKRGRARQ